MKNLKCGCCGIYFKTWDNYQDQDQDKGYGICEECQKRGQKRDNEIIREAFIGIYNKCSKENKKILKKYDLEQKRQVVYKMLENKTIKWVITK